MRLLMALVFNLEPHQSDRIFLTINIGESVDSLREVPYVAPLLDVRTR